MQLTKAMHDPALLDLRGKPILSDIERCNIAWTKICDTRGLDASSVEPAPGKNYEYFTALPKAPEEPS